MRRPRRIECGILKAVATDPQIIGNRRAAVFFGAVLCILLAFFAVERRVAAYPVHNIGAKTTAATGVQKPDQISFDEPQSFQATLLFAAALTLLIGFCAQCIRYTAEPVARTGLLSWPPGPLAVRPPPIR